MIPIGWAGTSFILGSIFFFFGPRKLITSLSEDLSPRELGFICLFFGGGLLIYGYHNAALDSLI